MILGHGPVQPGELWTAWSLELPAAVLLVIAAWLYQQGRKRLPRSTHSSPRRAVLFYSGLGAIGLALFSPLGALAVMLFTAHMVQHLALILIAAPLLVAARPVPVLLAGLPRGLATRFNRLRHGRVLHPLLVIVTIPIVVWAAHTVAMWMWHLPTLYDAAIENGFLHATEHAMFLGTGLLFWAVAFGWRRYGVGPALAVVFATALQSGALGAILAFAGVPLYEAHKATAPVWGIGVLTDQQLAGVMMWIPPGIVYLATMLALLRMWIEPLRVAETGPEIRGPT